MRVTIRRMGNSQGVLITKPLLAQAGRQDEAGMVIEKDAIVLRHPRKKVREGWAEASRNIATADAERLVWPEFANDGDVELRW